MICTTRKNEKAKSKPGHGSRPRQAPATRRVCQAGGPPTVFLIDADEGSQKVVREAVESMNLSCQDHVSGEDFLARYDPSRPGCLVMELRIAGQSGLLLQRDLHSRGCRLPVIFLTAHADMAFAVQAMRSGAIHFLEKPFRHHELWAAVQEAIELDRRRRETEGWWHAFQKRLERLNDIERQILELLGQGQSFHDIAHRLDVCVRTVELHRSQLHKKLDVGSLPQVVELGIVLNWWRGREVLSPGLRTS